MAQKFIRKSLQKHSSTSHLEHTSIWKMASGNKRPLSLAMSNPCPSVSSPFSCSDEAISCSKAQRRIKIQPIILKRSEIYNNCAPVFMFPRTPPNTPSADNNSNNIFSNNTFNSNNSSNLQSCLRPPSHALGRVALSHGQYSNGNNQETSVQFRPSVTVRRIPSRHSYSPVTKRELWASLDEIRQNALRNEAEFIFDGGDWRNVSEEDAMFYDQRSGTLIHPAHIDANAYMFDGHDWKPIALESKNQILSTRVATPAATPAAKSSVD